jgi:23S rRNA G2445 N2-methylase RlmL
VVLWDPCCGSGYLLTVIALLHRTMLRSVLATDIDPQAVELARQNLALLDPAALIAREHELAERAERFDKPSYLDTAQAAHRLSAKLTRQGGGLPVLTREANVFDRKDLAAAVRDVNPDVVITDVPYGEQTAWLGANDGADVPEMLAAIASVLPEDAVLGVTVRGRRVPLGGARRRESLKIGTRAVALLYAGDVAG